MDSRFNCAGVEVRRSESFWRIHYSGSTSPVSSLAFQTPRCSRTNLTNSSILVRVTNVLVEIRTRAIGLFQPGDNFGRNLVVSHRRAIQNGSQSFCTRVVSRSFMNLTALLLEFEGAVHYLPFTLVNLGFLAFAFLLAPREADAKIAPADSLLWPSFSIDF